MEEFSNFKLLPLIENTSRVDPTETNDDRRKRNVNALIDAVYPGIDVHDLRDEYFMEHAILAPNNASVRRINDMVAERLAGATREYLSVDSLEGLRTRTFLSPNS